MLPTIAPGDYLIIDKRRPPCIGDVVIVTHPQQPLTIVKRIEKISDGMLWLASDNVAEGSSSATFGPVKATNVRGVVTARF